MTTQEQHRRGIELFEQGEFTAAAQQFSQVIETEGTSEAWNDWATSQLACGKGREAERGYRRALDLDGHNSVAATNLVSLLGKCGRAAEALPYLEAAAADLPEQERQAIVDLVKRAQARMEESLPTTVEQFMAATGSVPRFDSNLPLYLKESLSRQYFDSSFYVKSCLRLLRRLSDRLWPEAIQALAHAAKSFYPLGLVVALYHLEAGDHHAALPFLRTAWEANPCDLYAEGLLIESEVAVAEAEGKPHPTFSGLREYLAASTCGKPFGHFELQHTGDVYLCCSGWLPPAIGNVGKTPPSEIWNSEMAQELRRSILDGSFKYCSKISCVYIMGRALPKRELQAASEVELVRCPVPDRPAQPKQREGAEPLAPVRKTGPRRVVLGLDRACNLACPQCRSDFYLSNKSEQEQMNGIFDDFLAGLSQDMRELCIDASGEVFVSKPSRRLLKQLTRDRYPELRFDLITNGQLFNRKTYEEFDLKGRLTGLTISIDAATEATYRIVRRGGDFNRLLLNLEFVNELRERDAERFLFSIRFCASAVNFREMVDFVRLARRFHATIGFDIQRKWGHVGDSQFEDINVASPAHPCHHEFLRVLQSPEFDDPIVDLGSVRQFRR